MTRLAIIAGQGICHFRLRWQLMNKAMVVIFPIEGQADAVFDGFVVQPVKLGAIGHIQGFFSHYDCRQMVMVGKVMWPSLGALRPDAAGMKLLGNLIKRGDDSVLRVIRNFLLNMGQNLACKHVSGGACDAVWACGWA